MKKILAVMAALVVVSFSSAAFSSTDDPSDPTSDNLVNLTYYAHPGRFLIDPTYSSSFHESNGTTTEAVSLYTLSVNYGLPIKGLRVGVSEGTGITASSDGTYSYYYSGIEDPTVALRYRVIDQADGQWSLDTALNVSPSIGTSTVAVTGTPGSNHKGYTTMSLVAAGYWNIKSNEAELSGELTHDFDGSGTDEVYPGNSYSRGSLWTKTLMLTDRFHFAPGFYLEGAADFDFDYTASFGYVSGASYGREYPFHVVPHLRVGCLPYKQLLLTASMTYNADTTSLSNNGTGTLTQTSHQATTWSVGAQYEF